MRGSWRFCRLFGIEVRIHATFLLLLAWVVLRELSNGSGVADALAGLTFMLALFGIVVLHELGHALVARRFGIRTRDITLLPIGGVARLEGMPARPLHELLVALAGPAVNLVLAAALFAVVVVAMDSTVGSFSFAGGPSLAKLFWVNVTLALFNLLPAFPMDGGRVLRAALAMKLDHARATSVAASVGQSMALGFGLLGLLGNPILVLIALFVWFGAAEEAAGEKAHVALRGVPVERLMIREFRVLSPDDTLARAGEHVLAGFQIDFPVVAEGQVKGVLTGANLLRGLLQCGNEACVGDHMRPPSATARPSDRVEDILSRLQGRECPLIPVLDEGRLVGILTVDNIGEFVAIQNAVSMPHDVPRARTARPLGAKWASLESR